MKHMTREKAAIWHVLKRARRVAVIGASASATREAQEAADRHGLTLIKDLCIAEEHRHLSQTGGHPTNWGVHVRRRKPTYEDNRRRPEESGYTAGGVGGRSGGGGVRAVINEKKMVKGAPSRRRGEFKPKPK